MPALRRRIDNTLNVFEPITLPLMFSQTRIQRWEGALLVAIYCGYMGWLFSRV